MEQWNRITVPIKKAWIGGAVRLGLKKTGLKRLKHEVKTCEYEDIRVLWEMLNKAEAEIIRSPPSADTKKKDKKKKKNRCALFEWARACRKI